jgi:hypothetical protein
MCRRGTAAAIYRLSRGCVARRDDRVQALCLHHAVNATPLGTMEPLAVMPGLDLLRGPECDVIPDGVLEELCREHAL